MPRKLNLNPDEMLQGEYKYIAQTAFQANEDRSRVTSFYFVSVGSFVAAIIGTRLEEQSRIVSFAFFALFLVLTFMGALTIAQLARLRAAWHESVEAMNQIKDFYVKHRPELADAFKWRARSIPPTNKPYSIANLIAVEVALLSSLTTGAGAYFLLSFLGEVTWVGWLIVFVSIVGGYAAQWAWYLHLLVDTQ
jgi:Na+/melibiose symporter-like transporter